LRRAHAQLVARADVVLGARMTFRSGLRARGGRCSMEAARLAAWLRRHAPG
jgi:hypothetical protein